MSVKERFRVLGSVDGGDAESAILNFFRHTIHFWHENNASDQENVHKEHKNDKDWSHIRQRPRYGKHNDLYKRRAWMWSPTNFSHLIMGNATFQQNSTRRIS